MQNKRNLIFVVLFLKTSLAVCSSGKSPLLFVYEIGLAEIKEQFFSAELTILANIR